MENIFKILKQAGIHRVRDKDGSVADYGLVDEDGQFYTFKKIKTSISGTNPRPQITHYFNGKPRRKNAHQYTMYSCGELPNEWLENTWVPDNVSKTEWDKTPKSVKQEFANVLGANGVQVDHIKPWSKGGDNSFRNLGYKLTTDNIKKGNKTQRIDRVKQFTDAGLPTPKTIKRVEGLTAMNSIYKRFDNKGKDMLKYPLEQYQK